MAASALLDPLAIPRSRLSIVIASAPRAAAGAPVSVALVRRGALALPVSSGLKISLRFPTALSSAIPASAAVARARPGAVVCEAQETAVEVPDVTKTTWQSVVLESVRPVLVEFWAPWCGPCCMIHPVIGKLSKDYEGKLECFKLNTDENPDIATQYGVRSIPTIMIFKNGEKKDAVIGAVPENNLVTCIEKFIEK